MSQISSPAVEIGFVAVMKGQEFHQTSADIVSLGEWRIWNNTGEAQNEGEHPEPLDMFEVYAFGTSLNSISSGKVTVPGGEVVNLVNDFRGDELVGEIGIENGYGSPLELNTARPDGVYTVQLTTASEGDHVTNFMLTGGTYPSVPHITNFSALQSATASSPVTMQWEAMAGGTLQDFIHIKVMQIGGEDDGTILWQSGMPGQPGALYGTSTHAEIPAGVLQAGRDYHAEVMFVKTVQALQGPPLEIAGYYKLTGFRIRTAAAQGSPLGSTLLRSNPRNGWSSVPRDAAVAFSFSHPMSDNPAHISITWTNNGGPMGTGTFSYHWTRENTVLLCKLSEPLPDNSEIGWTLNLAGFRDAAGFVLSGSPSGSFQTANYSGDTPDVGFISLKKTSYFKQTGAAPVPDGRFEARPQIEANAPNRLKSAALTAPGGRSGPFYADPWDGEEYEAPGEYGSKADLDRFYPNGDYQFSMNGLGDGARTVTLSLGSTDQYPDAPTITNPAALQAVDPAAPFTITWNLLTDWNNDFLTFEPGDGLIQLEILDWNGMEVLWVEGFEDLESGTEYEVPAGTLQPGRSYQANLYFLRITDLDDASYEGAIAVAAFESRTRFTIRTTGRPAVPALALQRIGGTARILATGGLSNLPYALEVSQNLQRWTPLEHYWNNGAAHQYDDMDAQYLKARFYRVRECGLYEQVTPHIAIQGTVWANGSHTTPVPGAVVGTSLDGQTTVTDAQGRFFLMTDTPSQGGAASYSIIITSGAPPRSFGPWTWGDQPRGQVFELN